MPVTNLTGGFVSRIHGAKLEFVPGRGKDRTWHSTNESTAMI
jgi:hypothetical protein